MRSQGGRPLFINRENEAPPQSKVRASSTTAVVRAAAPAARPRAALSASAHPRVGASANANSSAGTGAGAGLGLIAGAGAGASVTSGTSASASAGGACESTSPSDASLTSAVRSVFARAGDVHADYKGGYAAVLARKPPKKSFSSDFKAYEASLRAALEESRAALADAVGRAREVTALVSAREMEMAAQLAAGAGAAALATTVQQLRVDLSQAAANEAAADAEVAHAHALLAAADAVARDRESELGRLSEELADERALREGAEEDVLELRTARDDLMAERDRLVSASAAVDAELGRLRLDAARAADAT